MPQLPNVYVYGSHTCPDTQRAVKFLDSKQVAYEFKDVDLNPEYNDYIAGLNNGKRVMPTIQINNVDYFNPTEKELGQAVEKATQG
ncbi:MAG: glutaredoxin family protein [Planctomycetia bacterium]|nr:glutaredoxin family protein [Planctomycetia bacterium]